MLHKKREHKGNLAICWNFAAGNCEFEYPEKQNLSNVIFVVKVLKHKMN